MKEPKQVLASKIKEARERLGYTQKELAEATSLAHLQTISDIEQGKRDIKAWELVKLSKVLHISMTDLLSLDELPPRCYVAWREEPKSNREKIEARFLEKCRMYAQLEQWLDYCRQEKLPEFELDPSRLDFREARRMASTISNYLSLGRKPAPMLVSVLEEDFSIKIWYEDLDDGSAASAFSDDFGFAILMNRKEPPWRRNYNFAHELFHLITWDATRKAKSNPEYWSNIERMADVFASDLLLPAEGVLNAFECKVRDNRIDYSDLVEIAREFEVSTPALLWRLCHLGKLNESVVKELLNDSEFRAVDKATMAGNWSNPPETSSRYIRLACLAYKKDKVSRMQLSRYLDKSLMELPEVLSAYGFEEWENSEVEVTPS